MTCLSQSTAIYTLLHGRVAALGCPAVPAGGGAAAHVSSVRVLLAGGSRAFLQGSQSTHGGGGHELEDLLPCPSWPAHMNQRVRRQRGRMITARSTPQDFFFKEAKRLGYVARSAFKLVEIQEKFKVIPKGGRVLDLGCAPGAWLQVACAALGPSGGLVIGLDLTPIDVPPRYCDGRVKALCGDVFDVKVASMLALSPKGFTTLLSDMAPATTGISGRDSGLSLELAQRALSLAIGHHVPEPVPTTPGGGSSVMMRVEVGVEENRLDHAPTRLRLDHALDQGSGEARLEGEAGSQPLLAKGGAFVAKLLEGAETRELGKECKKYFKKVSWLRPKSTRSMSKEVYLIGQGRL